MLVGTPLPVNLSVFVALGPALWIGRALVRSQRGTSKAVATGRRFSLPRFTTSESRRNTGLGVPVPPVAIASQLRPA